MPLEFTSDSQPVIRLPLPHSTLLLTPILQTDGPATVSAMNSPLVYKQLVSPPFPFHLSDFTSSFDARAEESATAIKELKEVLDPKHERRWVSAGCPCTVIREEETRRLLGQIGCRLREFKAVDDKGERDRLREGNGKSAEQGDGRAEWEVGYWLAPEAHGKGVMAAALKALIEDWMVPYMNVRRVRAAFLTGNVASRRALEKCGFVLEKVVEDFMELSEKKMGAKGMRTGLWLMVWEREGSN